MVLAPGRTTQNDGPLLKGLVMVRDLKDGDIVRIKGDDLGTGRGIVVGEKSTQRMGDMYKVAVLAGKFDGCRNEKGELWLWDGEMELEWAGD